MKPSNSSESFDPNPSNERTVDLPCRLDEETTNRTNTRSNSHRIAADRARLGGMKLDRRAMWKRNDAVEPWRRFRAAIIAVLFVVAYGWMGYLVLGLPWFDALYQTIISITTVGYSEIGYTVENTTTYRVFTLSLVIVGVGAVLYTIGAMADSLIEGSLNEQLRRRRMLKAINELRGHTIIAGWGQVGHAVAEAVERAGAEVVVIDRNPLDQESRHPIVVAEATDDEVLRAAGIEHAKTLVIALDHDADNLFVCLSARALRPDLFIVARTSDTKNESKFAQAGANRVINPHEIGGSRMAALALRPHVSEFLDEVLYDNQHDVAVEEIIVRPGSPMIGRTLLEMKREDGRRSLIIAIRGANGSYHTNPAPDTAVTQDTVIIALGSADELHHLRRTVNIV